MAHFELSTSRKRNNRPALRNPLHSDQLVVVWQQDRTDGSWFTVSPANFLDWQRQTGTFDALAAVQQFQDVEFNLTTDATPQTVKGVHFSSELFRVLGVTPVLGRPFTSEDADVKTMVQVVDDSSARWRVSTYLFLGFAGIAHVLALIGLYSVTSFNVAQRSPEIALRLALGDSQAGIVRLILRSLSRVAVAGVVVGLVLALMIGRALSSLLCAVRPVDPIAFASASLGFPILVLIAATLSAFKASNIEPITALKAE